MDIKRAVIDLAPAPVVRLFAGPYVAGKGIESGVSKADEIWNARKLHSTVDLLGEEVFKREDVEATVALYFRMLDALDGRRYATSSTTSARCCSPASTGRRTTSHGCTRGRAACASASASTGSPARWRTPTSRR